MRRRLSSTSPSLRSLEKQEMNIDVSFSRRERERVIKRDAEGCPPQPPSEMVTFPCVHFREDKRVVTLTLRNRCPRPPWVRRQGVATVHFFMFRGKEGSFSISLFSLSSVRKTRHLSLRRSSIISQTLPCYVHIDN